MKKMLFGMLILNTILASFSVYAESSADNLKVNYPDPQRWADDIKKYQQWDGKNVYPKDAVLFYGSSSIVYWKTAESFGDLPVINRGFGGSYAADAVYYVKELVIRYKPRVVILYEGDNDIAGGIPPKLVHRDFTNLAEAIHAALPQTEIICLAVKLCASRWKWRAEVNELNTLNKDWCTAKNYITFVDTAAVLLGADQLPKSEYFLSDQLHLNEKGYAQWNALLSPVIKEKYKADELASMEKSNQLLKGKYGIVVPGMKLSDQQMSQWRSLKFGMFIHWGLYAIAGRGEWVMHNEKISAEDYAKFADEFNPRHFDADRWAQIAKDAGMKYMVLTARHHDGFCLWDSPASYKDFTSFKTAAGRDFVKDYVGACRKADLKVGIYYSLMDWRFPGYFKPKEMLDNALLMKKQCWGQVEELCSRYGKIDILWYDGGWLAHHGSDADAAWLWEPVKLNQMVRKYNPETVINPRSGWEGDFVCNEGDARVTGPILPLPWEKCLNLNRVSWGYNPKQNLMGYEEAIDMLLDVFVRDGNVLLNVGPDKDGEIPDSHAQLLCRIGDWMKAHGQSIYGTRGGPFQPTEFYGSTYRDNRIYVHIRHWPQNGPVLLPPLSQKITTFSLLAGGKVTVQQDKDAIAIHVDAADRKPLDTVVVLDLNQAVTEVLEH